MAKALKLQDTTIGKKIIMAVSGIMLLGFVFAHMAGNLTVYLPDPQAPSEYAVSLRQLPAGLLWIMRGVLLAAVLAHVIAAVQLWSKNTAARQHRYQKKLAFRATDYAARTMYFSGPILLFFILYHLAHLTFGAFDGQPIEVDGETYRFVFWHSSVYNNVVVGFRNPLVAGLYVVSNIFLGLHLFHGAWSLFQTIGASHARYNNLRKRFAFGFSFLVMVGNLSFPIAAFMSQYVPAIGIDPTLHAECYEELDPVWYRNSRGRALCGMSLMSETQYQRYQALKAEVQEAE